MATYYVRASGGNNGNPGTSFAQAWATIQYAVSNALAAGDIILICADGVHYITSAISVPTIYGAINNPINIRGASANGTDDGTQIQIDGSGISGVHGIVEISSTNFYIFSNISFVNSAYYGLYILSGSGVGSLTFKRCKMINSTTYGVLVNPVYSSPADIKFIECEIANNSDVGLLTKCMVSILNCSIHDNTSYGVYVISSSSHPGLFIFGSVLFNNPNAILVNTGNHYGHVSLNNVFYNNANSAYVFITGANIGGMTVVNNIFKDNGGYGLYIGSGGLSNFSYFDHNCFFQNVSGSVNFNGGTPGGDNNVFTDPLFISETPGSEDFRVQPGSPCRDTGYGYDG